LLLLLDSRRRHWLNNATQKMTLFLSFFSLQASRRKYQNVICRLTALWWAHRTKLRMETTAASHGVTLASALQRCKAALNQNRTKLVWRVWSSRRAVFVRFSLGGQSFDWRLATIAGMEVAKLVPWNSLLN